MILLKMPAATDGLVRLQAQLIQQLSLGNKVLWLVPGGSNIPGSVEVMAGISDELSANLTVALTDERYGPVGHADSNWLQLTHAGFDAKAARRIDVLQEDLPTITATAVEYAATLAALLDRHSVVIGQFGMGPDGHVAGILPYSVAIQAHDLVVGYQTPSFERITVTFSAIKRCSTAYLFAFGHEKLPMLNNLLQELPLEKQPAQILKQVPEVYICNDQIGDQS